VSSDEYDEERRRRRRRRRSSSRRSHGERRREEQFETEDGDASRPPDDEQRDDRPRGHERPEISLRTLLLAVGAALAAVLIAGGGWYYYRSVTSPEAVAYAEARNQPLVDMVIADQPGAERQLKAAIEQDLRQPNAGGPSRESAIISELRTAYIAPTLRRADDASLIATMAARAALIEHLNKTDTKACREFALGGIKNPDKLDPEGQKLYRDVLSAVEAAYRNGRAVKEAPAMPTLQEIVTLLNLAGFVKSDYDKLNSFATLSNDITCYIVLKVNQVPAKLKPEERGPYARFILGN
jgi:hypothetical protein